MLFHVHAFSYYLGLQQVFHFPLAPMATMYCAAKLLDFAVLGVPYRHHCSNTSTLTIITSSSCHFSRQKNSLPWP